MNFFHFFSLLFFRFSVNLRFFSFRCCLTSSWYFGNKAFTELSTSNWIFAIIVSDSNNSSSISSFSALLRIFCHFLWKSSLTGTIAGAFLMRSPNGVTVFERLSLKFSWWFSYLYIYIYINKYIYIYIYMYILYIYIYIYVYINSINIYTYIIYIYLVIRLSPQWICDKTGLNIAGMNEAKNPRSRNK